MIEAEQRGPCGGLDPLRRQSCLNRAGPRSRVSGAERHVRLVGIRFTNGRANSGVNERIS